MYSKCVRNLYLYPIIIIFIVEINYATYDFILNESQDRECGY